MSVRIGLIDSGIGPDMPVAATIRMTRDGTFDAALPDVSGHGSDMAEIVRNLSPRGDFLLAQVFDEALVTTPSRIAAGLDWCLGRGAQIVLMALGLSRDDEALRRACTAAAGAGVDLVASAPPRGEPVFPAGYPDVIAVCGDIRCAPGEISALSGAPADFGAAHVFGARRGASCAAAAVAGVVAAWRSDGGTGDARAYLDSIARYRGRERREA